MKKVKYKCKFDVLIKKLCNLYGIKIVCDMNYKEYKNLYKKLSGCKEWHTNSCTLAGKDEVYIGFYKNPHLKIISVLHEIGHAITTNEEADFLLKKFKNTEDWVMKYQFEKLAWEKAFILAEKYNIAILKSSFIWAEKQLETYKRG